MLVCSSRWLGRNPTCENLPVLMFEEMFEEMFGQESRFTWEFKDVLFLFHGK